MWVFSTPSLPPDSPIPMSIVMFRIFMTVYVEIKVILFETVLLSKTKSIL